MKYIEEYMLDSIYMLGYILYAKNSKRSLVLRSVDIWVRTLP